jgi:hypothetical protein
MAEKLSSKVVKRFLVDAGFIQPCQCSDHANSNQRHDNEPSSTWQWKIVVKAMQYISSGEAAHLHNSCALTRRLVLFTIHGPKRAEMFM